MSAAAISAGDMPGILPVRPERQKKKPRKLKALRGFFAAPITSDRRLTLHARTRR
jgi:hypothetical protein